MADLPVPDEIAEAKVLECDVATGVTAERDYTDAEKLAATVDYWQAIEAALLIEASAAAQAAAADAVLAKLADAAGVTVDDVRTALNI